MYLDILDICDQNHSSNTHYCKQNIKLHHN